MDNNYTVFGGQNRKPAKLFVIFNGSASEVILAGYQTLGRASSNSVPSIPVNSAIVSRNHGEFITDAYGTVFRDQGSTNGTMYNKTKLAPGQEVRLQDGDVLGIHRADDMGGSMDVLIIYSETYENCVWNTLSLAGQSTVNIGRSEALKLTNPEVSRRHAAFFRASGGWTIIDQGSTNGVYCNNMRVTEPTYLGMNDVVKIACYFFVFMGETVLYQCDATDNHCFNQGHNEFSQWSNQSVSVFYPESKPDYNYVNSYNQNMYAGQNGYANQNMYAGQNGYANQNMYAGQNGYANQNMYAGQNGYANQNMYAGGGLTININERSVWKRGRKKMLLKNVNMNIPSGSMVLILGGSGAGKTTFMNAVMGYEQAKGHILYNNVDIYAEFDRMQYEIGYVPQQDLMRMNDLALETVINAAQLKLQAGMPESFYIQQAEIAMQVLGLADEKQQMVRSLSGGQRKRLSIAMEYVGNPSLFFLDEPDSGVDNTNSELLLDKLRAISNEGKIVMFISHSPDRAIKLLDKVIILAKDSVEDCGRLVFYGNPYDALKFFEVENLNKIVSRINKVNEGGEGLADYYIEKYEREAHLYG